MSKQDLVVGVDVGNTNAVFGIFQGGKLIRDFRISTSSGRTADEYGALLTPLLSEAGLSRDRVGTLIVSSVVPPVNLHLQRLGNQYFGIDPIFVSADLDTGMEVRYDNPDEVGADRIVDAVAARDRMGAPVIAVDFGTATTFDVVAADGAYVGGVIAPGLSISAEALFARASRLFKVDVKRPERVLGSNTAQAMQAGLYWGYIGLVDGILERLREELGETGPVIATGGESAMIAAGSKYIDEIDPHLTLHGLRLIGERNCR